MKGQARYYKPGFLLRNVRAQTDGPRHAFIAMRRVAGRPWTKGRDAAAANARVPDAVQLTRDEGMLVCAPEAFPGVTDVVDEARRALDDTRSAAAPTGTGKKFLVNVLDWESLTRESPVVRFALREHILAGVTNYLGMPPLLTAIRVFISDHTAAAPVSSQLYHCDGDDVAQVKIFVHCSDVGMDSGPLTILPAAASARVRQATGYAYGGRLTDEAVAAHSGGVTGRPVTGPAGTVCFVDTSRCFHYGSRVEAGAPARLVAMIQYMTPYSFTLPLRFQPWLPFRHLATPEMSELQRLTLGA